MLQKCQKSGCNRTAFFKSSLRCPRCTTGSSLAEPVQLLPQNPYSKTERLVPNNQPDFIGIDLAAPGKSDYSAPIPPEYLGGGGASSSYSSDNGSSHSSSHSSSSSSDSSSGSSSSSDW